MSPRLLLYGRIALVLIAVSVAAVALRKGLQAARYFSTPIELSGTVTAAAFANAIPMARGNPRAGEVTGPIPTRLDVRLREQPGILFEVWLPEDPALQPPLPALDDAVILTLPGRWREMEVGPRERVLAFGLKRGNTVLVDAARYPYAAEYRTAFLAVGAAVGALIAAIGAWRLPRG
jgi:hypothetical protein